MKNSILFAFLILISFSNCAVKELNSAKVYYAMEMDDNLYNTEEYIKIDESGFINALSNPLSTFAADVDAASYSNARRFFMQDKIPYKDVVRSEEFINYFNYDYPTPNDNYPLSIYMEYSDCPWTANNKLVHIGIQGKHMQSGKRPASNLVFLLDKSGSMKDAKKLPLL